MDKLSNDALDGLIEKRKRLFREKRHLQARGYEEFVESGDIGLVRKTRLVAAQVAILDREIYFIKKTSHETVRLRGVKTGDFKRMADHSYAFGSGVGR